MDKRLFRYVLDISKKLDARFGKKTIAAKMTDVPGHTHAIVPYLAEYGIQYLHIGINSSSKVIKIPPLCRLRYGGQEIVINYASAYGGADTFGDYALEFVHTADNMGPPAPERVWAEIRRLQEKYPGAEIVSSTIDEFAREVLKHADSLPVVTEELGDTWIHGIGTDPYKVGAYGELLRLRDEWLTAEPAAAQTPEYREFSRNMMLICEHTWGRDVKRWLSDYKNWSKEDFQAARKRDLVTAEDTLPAGKLISDAAMAQSTFRNGQCRYSSMEESWQEQRSYVDAALRALPMPWREMGTSRLSSLRPQHVPLCENSTQDRLFSMNGYEILVQTDGSIRIDRTPVPGIAPIPALGRLPVPDEVYVTIREDAEKRYLFLINMNRESCGVEVPYQGVDCITHARMGTHMSLPPLGVVVLDVTEISKEALKKSSSAGGESFALSAQSPKQEIRTVFLCFGDFRLSRNILPPALADLNRASLKTMANFPLNPVFTRNSQNRAACPFTRCETFHVL